MRKQTSIFLTLLTLAACDAAPEGPQTLRSAECACNPTEGESSGGDTEGPLVFENTAGINTVSFMGSGRTYRVRYPNGFDPEAWQPGDDQLVPVFHFHSCSKDVSDNYYDSFRFRGFLPITIGAANECWDLTPKGPDLKWAQAVIEGIEQSPNFEFLDRSQRFLGGMAKGGYMSQVVGCRYGADAIASANGGLEDIENIGFREWAVTTPAPESCVSQPAMFINQSIRSHVAPMYPSGCFERATLVTYSEPGYPDEVWTWVEEDPEGELIFERALPHILIDSDDFFGTPFLENGDCVYTDENTSDTVRLAGTWLSHQFPRVGANVLDFWALNNESQDAWHNDYVLYAGTRGSNLGQEGPLADGSIGSVEWCGEGTNPSGALSDASCGCLRLESWAAGGDITFCYNDDDGAYFPEHKEAAERLFYSVMD